MTRPATLPLFGTSLGSRVEPPIGTLATGWTLGQVVPAKWLTWLNGLPGDWLSHLDETQVSLRDVGASDGDASRVSSTALTFLVGGPLLQYPVTGGVYWGRGQRLDASAVGATSGALYTFTANATNYIWLRYQPLTVRSSYPERAVTTVLAPPASGYVHVATVVTNATTVTAQSEPATVHLGPRWGGAAGLTHSFKRPLRIDTGGAGATELTVAGTPGGALPVSTWTMGGTLVIQQTNRPMIALASDASQTGLEGQALGGAAGTVMTLAADSVAHRSVTAGATSQSATIYSEANNLASHWLAVADPTLLGADAAPWTGKLRIAATGASEAGGLAWRSPLGYHFTPRASRMALSALPSIIAVNQTQGSGFVGALVTLACPLYQGHRYVFHVACESNAAVGVNYSQTVTITVNRVAQAPWNAKLYLAERSGFEQNWLSTIIHYTHAGADALAATVVLNMTHGIGAGNVTYVNPRILVISAVG